MARIVRQGEARVLDLPGRIATEVASAATGASSSTVRLVEIAPGTTSRGPHLHDGFEEVIHVLEGKGMLRTDGGDHPLAPGDTALVPSGERHQTVNVGNATLALVCVFPVADIRPGTREFESWGSA